MKDKYMIKADEKGTESATQHNFSVNRFINSKMEGTKEGVRVKKRRGE